MVLEVRKVATLGRKCDWEAPPGILCGPSNAMFLDNGGYNRYVQLFFFLILLSCTLTYLHFSVYHTST